MIPSSVIIYNLINVFVLFLIVQIKEVDVLPYMRIQNILYLFLLNNNKYLLSSHLKCLCYYRVKEE